MKAIAIIGPTASGKSDIALRLAKRYDAYILSIDSLSIYKEIDIVSAKPTQTERLHVKHFGIDILYPDERFNVAMLAPVYETARIEAQNNGKNLIIVGGSGFYLKTLLEGISPLPSIDDALRMQIDSMLRDLPKTYALLRDIDETYMRKIAQNDRYRIEKALAIYLQTSQPPSRYFAENPPRPVIGDLPLFAVDIARTTLRERIRRRTHKMVATGLIDEVANLERRYTRLPNAMGAIGIVETLEYLDAKIDETTMIEKIIDNTARLAKRQQTFNRHQFKHIAHLEPQTLYDKAATLLAK